MISTAVAETPEVAAIKARHPPGWIGTMLLEGESPIALCLKNVFFTSGGDSAVLVKPSDYDWFYLFTKDVPKEEAVLH